MSTQTVTFVGDGVTQLFRVPPQATVSAVKVNGSGVSFTTPTPGTISFTSIPAAAAVVSIDFDSGLTGPLTQGSTGIGVAAPLTALNAGQAIIQAGPGAGIMFDTVPAGVGSINVSQNANYNGGWFRIEAGLASNVYQNAGTHNFRTAATGAANSAIVWNNGMQVGATGVSVQGPLPAAQAGKAFLQLGGGSMFMFEPTPAGVGSINMAQNASFSAGAWTRTEAGLSSTYFQNNGSHSFLTAPTGAAGSALTWTTCMVVTNGSVQKIVRTKAGAVVAGDIPAGYYEVIKDSVGGTTKLCFNDGGVLKSVALA